MGARFAGAVDLAVCRTFENWSVTLARDTDPIQNQVANRVRLAKVAVSEGHQGKVLGIDEPMEW
jgi:hypothetical protein